MPKAKTYRVENITITCDDRCPIYFCNNPCRVRDHVKKYSVLMNEEGSYTIL
jgi:hypothetical protein